MKKWRCSVCGYIHTGDDAPEKCPVCGADKSLFEEVIEESEAASKAPEQKEKGSIKCSVCGYHDSHEKMSDKCPACGADKSLFEDISSSSEATKKSDKSSQPQEPEIQIQESSKPNIYDIIIKQMLKHHAHPILVHFPNGVIPMSVIFIIMAVSLEMSNLEIVSFYNMIFIVITMPLVLFSGYVEWKHKYGGHFTKVFVLKFFCAFMVTVSACGIVLWRILEPKVADVYSPDRWTFVLLHLVMLGAAIIAGLLGGKLVFKD